MSTIQDFKAKYEGTDELVCALTGLANPRAAGTIAEAGFDFVIVDLEHGNAPDETVGQIIDAIHEHALSAIKTSSSSVEDVQRAIGFGPGAIYVPMVDDKPSAEKVVQAVRDYAAANPSAELPVVVMMIESQVGVSNAAEIAAVDGVEGLVMGIGDLSRELGISWQLEHPKMEEAYRTVLAAGKENGLRVGIGGPGLPNEKWSQWAAEGNSVSITYIDLLGVRESAQAAAAVRKG